MTSIVIRDKYEPQTVAEVQQQVQRIQEIMSSVMIEGTHYGKVPGTNQNTLLKPGTELLLTTFRIAARPDIEDLSTSSMIRYRITTTGIHIPTGTVIGYGVGECSSGEGKYQWREAVCDQEYEEAEERNRRLKWKWEWTEVRGQKAFKQVKQVKTDFFDQANTVLKMAHKRSKSDLVLTSLAASDIFVQDMEDYIDMEAEPPAPHAKAQSAPPKTNGKAKPANGNKTGGKSAEPDVTNTPIKANQVEMIRKKLDGAGIDERTILMAFEVDMLDNLKFGQFNDAMEWINKTYRANLQKAKNNEQ